MSYLLIKKRPRFVPKELLKWYQKAPYSQYDIFEIPSPVFLRWMKPHHVYTYKSTVLELCEKYPDSEIGIYQINGEYIRASVLHKSCKEEFLNKSCKEEFLEMHGKKKSRKNLLLWKR